MALDSVRGQMIRFGNLLPFPNRANAPLFGAKSPAIQTASNIRIGNQSFADLFETSSNTSANIVLRPADSLETDLAATLVNKIKQKALTGGTDPVTEAAKLLASALKGDAVDPNRNVYATYTAKSVSYKSREAKASRQAKLTQVGNANLSTLLNTVQGKLKALPKNVKSINIELPTKLPDGVKADTLVRELGELLTLNGYNYNFHKQNSQPSSRITDVSLNKGSLSGKSAQEALTEGQAIGAGTNLTRHLVDTGANRKSTLYISQKARELASPTLNVDVLEGADLEGQTAKNNKRMGLFLSVAQGNAGNPDRAPRLVEMVYTPKDGQYNRTILLVGKGIVFDTGGNNLKPSEYIHNMEGDMAGAAAVIGTLKTLDALQVPGVRVIGLAPLTENRLGSNATLPNDLYTARNGKTVQISNTDAEGRLVLADAMHYGIEKYQPDVVSDIATLTGGKVRAIGGVNAVALSGNNPDFMKQVNSLETNGLRRKSVALELNKAHHDWVTRAGKGKADVYNSVSLADAKRFKVIAEDNVDATEPARQHSAQGAAFLREFFPKGSEKTPWVHYDMAGAEFGDPDPVSGETWATGFGVKDLYFLVKGVAEGKVKPQASKTETVKFI